MKPSNDFSQAILTALRRKHYQPRRSKELARDLNIDKRFYPRFRDCLKALEVAGTIERRRGNRWAVPEDAPEVTGKIQVTRAGCGFLLPDDPHLEDVYVPETELGTALNGDHVRVRLRTQGGRDFRQVGQIIEIIERHTTRIVSLIKKDGTAQPEDPKNPFHYELEADGIKAKIGEKVLLEITVWGGGDEKPRGRILDVLGPAGAPDTETAAILASFDAPGSFSDEVKDAVRALDRALTPAARASRLDLTKTVTITIDPVTARDFDDALSCEVRENGDYIVGVHIADVAHYVTPGSVLDAEARDRSTSIYLPTRVLPMLPEEISNDLCSLRPHEERCVKTVFLIYSADGKRKDYHIHRSIIRSHHRFAYEDARDLLSHETLAAKFPDQAVIETLRRLHHMSKILRQRRLDSGSIELHLPELTMLFDAAGQATEMVEIEHDFSHQLVEEFMLAANIALAEWCAENEVPTLHRVHESPSEEDIEELSAFLIASGYPFRPPFRRERLNDVIDKARGKPEEHAINLSILKSFKKAVYEPDASKGHFALNFPRYMHFTSPIRRYPDLHLHQALDAVFGKKANKLPKKIRSRSDGSARGLVELGIHASGRERRAMKIEEGVKDFRRLELLSRREEREFTAIVTGMRKFGIFVEIENFLVEGMIPRVMLEKKGFTTREEVPGQSKRGEKPLRTKRGGRGFHLGQEVRVRITRIDLSARLCEMEFLGLP